MHEPQDVIIGWKVYKLSITRAIAYYRSLLPALFLASHDIQSTIFSKCNPTALASLNYLVIAQRPCFCHLRLAKHARAKGVVVVYDLCDHIFLQYKSRIYLFLFKRLMKYLTFIVVSTQALAKVVEEIVQDAIPIYVISDGENNLRLIQAARQLLSKQHDANYKEIFSQHEALGQRNWMWRRDKPIIMWFGGARGKGFYGECGMLDILLMKDALETLAEDGVELIIVSNRYRVYKKLTKKLKMKTVYVEWSPEIMPFLFSQASVVIVPNPCNAFTICKSPNRTIYALSHGVPVVATMTPALASFKDCIEHEDYLLGLRRYLTDPAHVKKHVEAGRQLIEKQFSAQAIAELWVQALKAHPQIQPYFSETNSIQGQRP